MYQDDDMYERNRRRRRGFLYGSFLLCLLGAALGSAAFGTQFWYNADVSNLDDAGWQGKFHTGLFSGKSILVGLAPSVFIYHTVCSDGSCMFSCGPTKNAREKHLQEVLDGTINVNSTQQCLGEADTTLRHVFSYALPAGEGGGRSGLVRLINSRGVDVDRSGENDDKAVTEGSGGGGHQGDGGDRGSSNAVASNSADSSGAFNMLSKADSGGAFNILGKADSSAIVSVQLEAAAHRMERPMAPFSGEERVFPMAWVQDATFNDLELSTTTPGGGGGPEISGTDGLLSHGLWAGTIACLALGLLFAVLGAFFAVVNTATTPVEAITGIPGLYIWNGLAALFELVAVICWSVQFSSHLTSNVLIVDSLGGWTTEGGEALGYSFWLVVVAVVVHIANCGLIGFGTYEPKVKEKIQEPDKANNDILLY